MKRYHPIGVAVNPSGVRTHYLLSDLDGTQLKRNNPSPRAAVIVDHAEFTNMVVDEEVQYFQGSPTGPVIKYTDEEVKSLTGKKGSIAMYTGDNYWKNEVVFCDQFIKELNSVNISLLTLRIMKPMNVRSLTGGVYAPNAGVILANLLKSCTTMCRWLTPDFCLCMWMEQLFHRFIQEYNGPISINTGRMCDLENHTYALKMLGFANPTQELVDTVASSVSISCDATCSKGPRYCGSVGVVPEGSQLSMQGTGVKKMSF